MASERHVGCKWTYDDEHDKWNTECDKAFCFFEGGPVDQCFVWCPFCGFVIIPEREDTDIGMRKTYG